MNVRNIQAKKVADYSLVQSEQRLSLLLNNTEESFIILNSRLRITAYNRAAQEHSPYFFKEELQSGVSILDLVSPEDMETTINLFETVFEGAEVERETTSVCAGNHLHIYSHIYRPLINSDNDIFGVFITSKDITKRKIAEQQLKESEIRFKTIIQESFDAVIITDAEANIIYTSPSITNVLGYCTEELVGKNGFAYIHEDFLPASQEKFNELIVHPQNEQNIDVKMRHKNGAFQWIEVKGKNMSTNKYVQGILISLRDITDRKNAEELILLSEQRFKGLVQSGADMISILDTNYIVQYSSPTVKSIIGIDPVEHKGRGILENVHPDDYSYVKEKFDGLW
ncbi:MAG: PAS domain S-box protein, partial [Flavobacterium sp.]